MMSPSDRNMMISFTCTFFMLLVVKAQDDELQVIGPDRVQDIYACVGTNAFIPWPLNIISRTGHRSTVIYLSFQRRHSERKMLIASFSGQRELTIDGNFKNRLSLSSENSGIFLEQTTMDDAGIYTAQARVSNGQIWTRTTNLTVLLRPMIFGGRLNISKSEVTSQPVSGSSCVNLTCGMLEFAGYPPVTFVWTTPTKTLSMVTATDDIANSLQVCSPYFGNVTCSLAGFSSVCTYDNVATLHLDLPDPPLNRTTLAKSTGAQDLALTIVMPILAVLVPLAILGVWVLSHVLKTYPQYRDQHQFGHGEAQVDVDENGTTGQTNADDVPSDEDNDQTQIKEDEDNDDQIDLGNHHSSHLVVSDNGDDDKASEDKPLMNTSVSTTV